MRLSTSGLSVEIDPDTHCLTFDCLAARALRTSAPPRFDLAGKPVTIRSLKPLPDGFQTELHGEEAEGTWQLRTRGDVLESRIERAGAWTPRQRTSSRRRATAE